MSHPSRYRVLGSMLIAVAAAGLGRRLLAPREQPLAPASADLEEYFTSEQIVRAARFARPQLALALGRAAVDTGALATLVRRPPRLLTRTFTHPVRAGAIAGAGLACALSLPPLPLAAISRRRAKAVGLVTQSWPSWAVDLAKATAIEAALAGAAGAATVVATRQYPRGWWLPAAATSVSVGAVFVAVAPLVLDPVFNDFTPLPEGETRADVLELARAAGVQVGEVFSVDASRRTTAANAYVAGLGPTKRVVLFDTLLDRYDRNEVRVVVAHELAHVRNRDVQRGVLYAAVVAPAAVFAVQQLSWRLSRERGSPGALPALALSAVLVGAPVGLVGNGLSRAFERCADAYSLDLSRSPEAFVSLERRIAIQNVADLDPPCWVRSLVATHPSTLERIGAAVAWSQRNRDGGLTPAFRPTQAGS